MRTVIDLYKEYKIPPNLQQHQLRVAAVAAMICENWEGPSVEVGTIVSACLLHDMGNIVKYTFTLPEDLANPEATAYWREVKKEFVEKYGDRDHHATIAIVREIGQPESVISLIDMVGHLNFSKQVDARDMNALIINYADTRVSLYGVVPFTERMDEVWNRYKNNPGFVSYEVHSSAVDSGHYAEELIFKNCRIKPGDITDQSIATIIEHLKEFVIE